MVSLELVCSCLVERVGLRRGDRLTIRRYPRSRKPLGGLQVLGSSLFLDMLDPLLDRGMCLDSGTSAMPAATGFKSI